MHLGLIGLHGACEEETQAETTSMGGKRRRHKRTGRRESKKPRSVVSVARARQKLSTDAVSYVPFLCPPGISPSGPLPPVGDRPTSRPPLTSCAPAWAPHRQQPRPPSSPWPCPSLSWRQRRRQPRRLPPALSSPAATRRRRLYVCVRTYGEGVCASSLSPDRSQKKQSAIKTYRRPPPPSSWLSGGHAVAARSSAPRPAAGVPPPAQT